MKIEGVGRSTFKKKKKKKKFFLFFLKSGHRRNAGAYFRLSSSNFTETATFRPTA